MIQIQPFTLTADSASPAAANVAIPGSKITAFADFLGDGAGGMVLPQGIGKGATQSVLFPSQIAANEALALISGAATQTLPATADGASEQILAPGDTEGALEDTAAGTAPADLPDELVPLSKDATALAQGKPDVPATDQANGKPDPAIPPARAGAKATPTTGFLAPELAAEVESSAATAKPSTFAAKIGQDAPAHDVTAHDAGDPDIELAASAGQSPHARTTAIAQAEAAAIAPNPMPQPMPQSQSAEQAAAESEDAKILPSDRRPDEEHRPRAMSAAATSVGRQSHDQPRLPQTSETSNAFAAQVESADSGSSAGWADGGVRSANGAGGILTEAKVPAAAQAAMPATISGRPGEIGRQLGVEIARHSAEGRDNLIIRLDPAELGKIHIRLHFDDGGQLRAHVSAESAVALDMLRRDSSDLSRALGDAGVRTDSQSFQFDSRGQQREQNMPRSQPDWRPSTEQSDLSAESDVPLTQRRLNPNGALDLFA